MPEENTVIAIVSQVLGVDLVDLSSYSSSENVQKWDSARHFLIILAIEEKYGVELTPKQFRQATSIAGILQVLEQTRE